MAVAVSVAVPEAKAAAVAVAVSGAGAVAEAAAVAVSAADAVTAAVAVAGTDPAPEPIGDRGPRMQAGCEYIWGSEGRKQTNEQSLQGNTQPQHSYVRSSCRGKWPAQYHHS